MQAEQIPLSLVLKKQETSFCYQSVTTNAFIWYCWLIAKPL